MFSRIGNLRAMTMVLSREGTMFSASNSTNSQEETGCRNAATEGKEVNPTTSSPAADWIAAIRSGDFAVWLDRGIFLAVLLASGVALSLNVADPDLWGHVQYGRDALAHGLSATTTYSYVANGYPWINHEIVAELAMATVANWFGGPGLLIVKCLL